MSCLGWRIGGQRPLWGDPPLRPLMAVQRPPSLNAITSSVDGRSSTQLGRSSLLEAAARIAATGRTDVHQQGKTNRSPSHLVLSTPTTVSNSAGMVGESRAKAARIAVAALMPISSGGIAAREMDRKASEKFTIRECVYEWTSPSI